MAPGQLISSLAPNVDDDVVPFLHPLQFATSISADARLRELSGYKQDYIFEVDVLRIRVLGYVRRDLIIRGHLFTGINFNLQCNITLTTRYEITDH